MRVRFLCRAAIALSIAIGAVVGATEPLSAQSEQTRQITVVQEMAPVGLAAGQTLRYTWANLAAAESQKHYEPLRVVVRLLADDGTMLAQDVAEAVGPGRFQVFDFSRGAIGRAVPPFLWSVTDTGIAFVTREPDFDAIDAYRFSDERVARVGRLAFRVPASYTHMTVSRDARWALATNMVRFDSDLMRLDNFR